jgi:hypothetical protein
LIWLNKNKIAPQASLLLKMKVTEMVNNCKAKIAFDLTQLGLSKFEVSLFLV